MKRFLKRLCLFIVPLVGAFFIGLFSPPTPRAAKSLYLATLDKDALLRTVEGPRMIFVGGSNLSFGLNSQMIKDELKVNPINTGVHANLGLRFMLGNVLQFIKEGDVVVLALEYGHYSSDYDNSSEELLRTVFEVDRSKLQLLSRKQALRLIPRLPKYAFSKYNPTEYITFVRNPVYKRGSFNEYGDVDAHWGLPKKPFPPFRKPRPCSPDILKRILEFRANVESRGAVLLVTYPCYQDRSYDIGKENIEQIAESLEGSGLTVLGTPERYRIPDEMTYNTPFHMSKEGADLRTSRFIEDYRASRRNLP